MASRSWLDGLVILVIVIFTNSSLVAQQKIEGLFYYDNAPVSIEIENGIIQQVTRLNNVPDDFPQVIIAPGFLCGRSTFT